MLSGSLFQSNVYWPNIHSINLALFNISRDDNNYQLTCIAENVVGMTNSSIQLNVQCEFHFSFCLSKFLDLHAETQQNRSQ